MILGEHLGISYPADIQYHPDENACTPAAFAFLMFRIGAPEPLWTPGAMDAMTGRKPGELTHNSGVLVHALLGQGATIVECSSFDNNRFVRDGLQYLEEYHAAGWLGSNPAAFYDYWTDSRIDVQMQHTADYIKGVAKYGDSYTAVTRKPDVRFVLGAIQSGVSALVATHRVEPNIRHDIVVVGSDEPQDSVVAFDNQSSPPICAYTMPYFCTKLFNADAGVLVVSRS